jgi:hypothetical protein
MVEIEVDQLQKAIEGLHRYSARLVQSVPIKQTHEGVAVWEGVVHVFDLEGHPTASRAYAYVFSDRGNHRWAAVLRRAASTAGLVAIAAVRAAIMAEHRQK